LYFLKLNTLTMRFPEINSVSIIGLKQTQYNLTEGGEAEGSSTALSR